MRNLGPPGNSLGLSIMHSDSNLGASDLINDSGGAIRLSHIDPGRTNHNS